MRRALAVLLLSLPALAAAALSDEQQARYDALIRELRCLVCQNETIADSTAPLAADLRQQVEAQIAAGRSDAEIKRYLTDRYGDFVLYRPPFKAKTWLLWGGPFVVLLFALIVALRFARARKVAAPAAVDREALQRLLAEEYRREPKPDVESR
ncbi:cytochrome c-type biogenesis protein [Solimonas soli]|uniref:cytochrome c-type biogenesis protein n=1 Tax=Solimonas soli TaxID=413479 RepID=UPI00048816A3|nr:cytochrome c-type biogenesis protein [Solimonas soli]